MKLYTTGRGHWAGTQADAKKLGKQESTTCDVYEVPVDKQGLLGFLNDRHVRLQDEAMEETTDPPKQVPLPSQHTEAKIVGQTHEKYMRNWKQEQADWNSEYKCNEAIETVLWDAPNQFLGNYIAIIIDRMTNLKGDNEDGLQNQRYAGNHNGHNSR